MSNNIPGTDQFHEDGVEAVQPEVEPAQDIILSRSAARRKARVEVQKSAGAESKLTERQARKQFEKALKASTRAEAAVSTGPDLKIKKKSVVGRLAFTGVAILAIAGFGAGIILPSLGAVADSSTAQTGELIPMAIAQPLESQSLAIESYDSKAAPMLTKDTYQAEAPPRPVVQQVSQRWSYHLGTFTNNPNAKVQWPFRSSPISSPYGPRWGGMHTGTDFDMPMGAPVGSVSAGKVVAVGWNIVNGCGYGVLIDHGVIGGQKTSSLSCHMMSGSSPLRTGQEVSAGQMIGKVGTTGWVTGAHLHLEIWINGSPFGKGGKWADPFRWLKTYAG